MDDVKFSHNVLYDASCAFLSGESVTAETTSIDFNQILLNDEDQQVRLTLCTRWVVHWGRNQLFTIALLVWQTEAHRRR